jgi:hypothetical protein
MTRFALICPNGFRNHRIVVAVPAADEPAMEKELLARSNDPDDTSRWLRGSFRPLAGEAVDYADYKAGR